MPTGRVYQREASPHSSARDELHLCVRAGVPETAVGAHSAKAPSAEPGARQLTPIADGELLKVEMAPRKPSLLLKEIFQILHFSPKSWCQCFDHMTKPPECLLCSPRALGNPSLARVI